MSRSDHIVSPDWLEERLHQPGLTIIDGSWYLPDQTRDARAEYDAAHIPGAVFFDHDLVVDPDSALPHALPAPAVFEQHASAMGITRDDEIVVYDGPGYFSAPRVWWMFRAMGAQRVHVLDGGFDNWKAAGRPVTATQTKTAASAFVPQFDAAKLVTLNEMRAAVADGSHQIADARSPGRFSGSEPEPRPGMRSGHMPGAFNVHYASLSQDGHLKSADDLSAVFADAGIDPQQPVVTTCGSGVTAAVLTLALNTLGNDNVRLYDGSWSQWSALDDTPIETG